MGSISPPALFPSPLAASEGRGASWANFGAEGHGGDPGARSELHGRHLLRGKNGLVTKLIGMAAGSVPGTPFKPGGLMDRLVNPACNKAKGRALKLLKDMAK